MLAPEQVCKDSGGESGEWQCSAGAAGSEEGSEEDSWPCAARACVEVSHCDALSDTFDTGCASSTRTLPLCPACWFLPDPSSLMPED